MGFVNTLTHGSKWIWITLLGFAGATVASAMLVTKTADLRYQRDVNRMVFNDNLNVLQEVKAKLGLTTDSLNRLVSSPAAQPNQPYIVISIAERELWYKRGNEVLFHTQVATGSGKTLVSGASGKEWKFETPRGRLRVEAKEVDPAWVPPDWHFQEQAMKRGLGVVRLERGRAIPSSDGSVITVSGTEVVRRYPNGSVVPLEAADGREIVANGNIIIPPFGTTQRRYLGVLGTRRLKLGDGYGLHGTNQPETIGRAVSHGCVRLRNEDIEKLYEMVPVGTPVFIY
ncbi:MAG TPA: L,D-transpeptidase [Gemmatimonadaceae bacterium]|nr:L,D-transpeptidase [Gemmatimonadaceae bacterium]